MTAVPVVPDVLADRLRRQQLARQLHAQLGPGAAHRRMAFLARMDQLARADYHHRVVAWREDRRLQRQRHAWLAKADAQVRRCPSCGGWTLNARARWNLWPKGWTAPLHSCPGQQVQAPGYVAA